MVCSLSVLLGSVSLPLNLCCCSASSRVPTHSSIRLELPYHRKLSPKSIASPMKGRNPFEQSFCIVFVFCFPSLNKREFATHTVNMRGGVGGGGGGAGEAFTTRVLSEGAVSPSRNLVFEQSCQYYAEPSRRRGVAISTSVGWNSTPLFELPYNALVR